MVQEEKDLLLKDLCGRLPYKICARQYYSAFEDDFIIEGIIGEQIYAAYSSKISMAYPVEKVKPYLRPVSSMTEGEKEDFGVPFTSEGLTTLTDTVECMDWLNKHHFDYRGLIPMGLALEALEGMYEM